MSTRSDVLDNIVTNYMVIICNHKKIYHMPNFVEFIKQKVRTESGRLDMQKTLAGIYKKASKTDQKRIDELITQISFYESFID